MPIFLAARRKSAAASFIPGENDLNTLPMQDREAREFAAGLFPDKDLMTYQNGRRAPTRLGTKADSLAAIKYTRNDDDQEAKGVVDDVLLCAQHQ
jgi:hypothetical protein